MIYNDKVIDNDMKINLIAILTSALLVFALMDNNVVEYTYDDAGTEFKIFDMDNEKYVEQVTTYPITIVHKSYFTDADGYLILPQNLEIGHYRIEEVTAPDGYTINKNYVEIKVDSDTLYQIDPISGEAIDIVKKYLYQGHELNDNHLAKELGDVAWYIAATADALGYDLETILQMNIDKLKARYPDGFDVERSIHRKKDDI